MKTAISIIENLSRKKVVESMVLNITHCAFLNDDLQDLSQMVYLILLQYPKKTIARLDKEGALNFFVVRIILNQYKSQSSDFWQLFHKFQDRTIYMGFGDVGESALEAMKMVYVPRILQY